MLKPKAVKEADEPKENTGTVEAGRTPGVLSKEELDALKGPLNEAGVNETLAKEPSLSGAVTGVEAGLATSSSGIPSTSSNK